MISLVTLILRSNGSKEIEILVLRHELEILRRKPAKVATSTGRSGVAIRSQSAFPEEALLYHLASGLLAPMGGEHIRDGLAAMTASGELRPDTDVDWLAASTLASLQGGLVLTQARRDPWVLRRALDGALALIAAYRQST